MPRPQRRTPLVGRRLAAAVTLAVAGFQLAPVAARRRLSPDPSGRRPTARRERAGRAHRFPSTVPPAPALLERRTGTGAWTQATRAARGRRLPRVRRHDAGPSARPCPTASTPPRSRAAAPTCPRPDARRRPDRPRAERRPRRARVGRRGRHVRGRGRPLPRPSGPRGRAPAPHREPLAGGGHHHPGRLRDRSLHRPVRLRHRSAPFRAVAKKAAGAPRLISPSVTVRSRPTGLHATALSHELTATPGDSSASFAWDAVSRRPDLAYYELLLGALRRRPVV